MIYKFISISKLVKRVFPRLWSVITDLYWIEQIHIVPHPVKNQPSINRYYTWDYPDSLSKTFIANKNRWET